VQAMRAPARDDDPLSGTGAEAGDGVAAGLQEESEATRAAKSGPWSAAERFSSRMPSFLSTGHFKVKCLLPRAELWQMTHLSEDSERDLRQRER
jgi:hypothetical protein